MRMPQVPEGLGSKAQAFLMDSASDLTQVASPVHHNFFQETSLFVP